MRQFNLKKLIQTIQQCTTVNSSNNLKVIENYIKNFGEIPENVEETEFYKRNVSKFTLPDGIRINTPPYLEDKFDWHLLIKLVFCSFSCSGSFVLEEEVLEFYICVDGNDRSIEKKVSELWPKQIQELYRIIVMEQMSLFNLMIENEKEKAQLEKVIRIKALEFQTIFLPDLKELIERKSAIDSFLSELEFEDKIEKNYKYLFNKHTHFSFMKLKSYLNSVFKTSQMDDDELLIFLINFFLKESFKNVLEEEEAPF